MKRSILADIATLQGRQMGYVAALSYQYSQLCVKADPALLLGIVLDDDGVERNIEDLAQVMVYEDKERQDRMDLIPKYSNDSIPVLAKGVTEFYPEIKQSVETNDPDDEDEMVIEQKKAFEEQYGIPVAPVEKSYFLVLTMPEVDDDRKKKLDDAVDVIHDAIKARMDSTLAFFSAQVTAKSMGETPEDVKAAEDQLKEVQKQYDDMRETLTEDKKKEIQEANVRYHQKDAEKSQAADDADDSWKKLKMV